MMMHETHAAMTLMIAAHVAFYLALLTLVVLGVAWLIKALRTQPAHLDATEIPRRRHAAGETSADE